MSRVERQAAKKFQDGNRHQCTFGSRIKPPHLSLGTPLEDYYWSASVKVFPLIMDQKNEKRCFIVEDEQRKVLGIAVMNSHDSYNTLIVLPQDVRFYNTVEEREFIIEEFKDELSLTFEVA